MKKINKLVINSFNHDKYHLFIKDTIIKHRVYNDVLYYERFINNIFFGISLKIIKNL